VTTTTVTTTTVTTTTVTTTTTTSAREHDGPPRGSRVPGLPAAAAAAGRLRPRADSEPDVPRPPGAEARSVTVASGCRGRTRQVPAYYQVH
jgi:hypothetical protein